MAESTRRSARFSVRSKLLGQLLLENGDIKAEDIAQAISTQEEVGGMVGKILREQKSCDELAIGQALQKQVQVTDIRCEDVMVDPGMATLVPRDICETEKLCPFERLGGLLCVVMANPLNRKAITKIEYQSNLKVKSFKSPWLKIYELINRTYGETVPEAGDTGEQLAVEGAPVEPETGIALPIDQPADAGLDLALAENYPAAAASAPRTPVQARRPERKPEAPSARAVVKGMESLDEGHAEVIETNARGLTKRPAKPQKPAPLWPKAAEKKAKVNVDLDKLDLSSGEMIKDAEEGMVELYESAPVNKPLARHAGKIVALKMMRDSYFYMGGRAPAERTEEFLNLLESLPAAEVVAQSIGEYESDTAPSAEAAGAVTPPQHGGALELRQAPSMPMAAVPLEEAEFQKAAAQLVEDPVGEWDWQTAAPGPLPVLQYDEN
jgi:hypothetical protein